MRFDDRLLTVLSQPGGDRRDVAVRWRQLVDLVARSGANAGSAVIEQALETIRADAGRVEEPLRAAAARAVAALPLPLALLEIFAVDRLIVSAPVLAAASLDRVQWQALLAGADEETRRFVEALHPEIGVNPSDLAEERLSDVPEPTFEEPLVPSLHDLVERIERRRRSRAEVGERNYAGVSRSAAPALFRWECGPGGEIDWVEGAPRGPLIGRSIARRPIAEGDLLDKEVVRSFTVRAPFRDAGFTLGGDAIVSGEWRISGVPAFDPADGRFVGYRGIALRDPHEVVAAGAELLADADSIRELVHEIKTPLTAIIGFAEIIEGQYLGPAERVYRDRAQEIVSQARLLLEAIEDLDFVARVHSAGAGQRPQVNLSQLLERATVALREAAASRGVEIQQSSPVCQTLAAADPDLADRLVFRLCTAVLGQAEAGERLRLAVEKSGDCWQVSIGKPARLARICDADLRSANPGFDSAFPLRLVRGLAKSAGAELISSHNALTLLFRRF